MAKTNLSLFKKSFFSIIPLAVLLLIVESYFRVRMYFKYDEPYYLTAPFFKKVIKTPDNVIGGGMYYINRFPQGYFKIKPGIFPSHVGYYTINSLGFRGEEFSPFDKDEIRIFAIGGSSTFCAESDDNYTWPARLEYYLNIKRDKFEVINSGFPFYDSLNYLNLIQSELIKYKPDIFIIYEGFNDLHRIDKEVFSGFLLKIHKLLYFRSMFYTSLVEKMCLLSKNVGTPTVLTVSKFNEDYEKNLEKIIKICSDNNIKLIFVRQLLNMQKNMFLEDGLSMEEIEKALTGPKDKFSRSYAYPSIYYWHNKAMQKVKDLSIKYNLKFLDFRNDFYTVMDEKSFFFDWVHLFPEGNDLLARLIAENLLEKER